EITQPFEAAGHCRASPTNRGKPFVDSAQTKCEYSALARSSFGRFTPSASIEAWIDVLLGDIDWSTALLMSWLLICLPHGHASFALCFGEHQARDAHPQLSRLFRSQPRENDGRRVEVVAHWLAGRARNSDWAHPSWLAARKTRGRLPRHRLRCQYW